MKKFKKMFMSIMMVVVSVSMLTTASFAWFAMSKEVQANQMEVEVLTPGDILIHAGLVSESNFITFPGENGEAQNIENMYDEEADGSGPLGFSRIARAIRYNENKLAPVSSADGLNFYFGKPELVGTATGTPDLNVHESDVIIEEIIKSESSKDSSKDKAPDEGAGTDKAPEEGKVTKPEAEPAPEKDGAEKDTSSSKDSSSVIDYNDPSVAFMKYVDTTSFQTAFGYSNKVVPYVDFKFTLINTTDQKAVLIPSMTFVNEKYANAMRASIHIVQDGVLDGKVTGDPKGTEPAKFIGAGIGYTKEGKAIAPVNPVIDTTGKKAAAFPTVKSPEDEIILDPTKKDPETGKFNFTYIVIRVWLEGGEANVTKANFRKGAAGKFQFAANFKLKQFIFDVPVPIDEQL